jgi:hypothetical protein
MLNSASKVPNPRKHDVFLSDVFVSMIFKAVVLRNVLCIHAVDYLGK